MRAIVQVGRLFGPVVRDVDGEAQMWPLDTLQVEVRHSLILHGERVEVPECRRVRFTSPAGTGSDEPFEALSRRHKGLPRSSGGVPQLLRPRRATNGSNSRDWTPLPPRRGLAGAGRGRFGVSLADADGALRRPNLSSNQLITAEHARSGAVVPVNQRRDHKEARPRADSAGRRPGITDQSRPRPGRPTSGFAPNGDRGSGRVPAVSSGPQCGRSPIGVAMLRLG